MKQRHFLHIFFLTFIFTFSISAQSSPEVSLNVTVTDAQGRFVDGLTADNFKLYENGKEQKINSVKVDESPLSIGFLVDISGSMSLTERNTKINRVDWGRQAILDFLRTVKGDNEYFISTFSEPINHLSDFVNKDETIRILKKNENFSSPKARNTAFYDATIASIEKLSKAKNERKVLFILSDGNDNVSKSSFGKLEKLIKGNKIIFFILSVYEKPVALDAAYSYYKNPFQDSINKMIKDTGGKAFVLFDLKNTIGYALSTAHSLQKQYKLSFTPEITDKNNKWRNIRVSVETPSIKNDKLYVNHRKGYFTISEFLPKKLSP